MYRGVTLFVVRWVWRVGDHPEVRIRPIVDAGLILHGGNKGDCLHAH